MRCFLAAATGAAFALVPTAASAQEHEPELRPVVVRVELGGGTMINDFVDTPDDTTIAANLAARVSYRLAEPFSVQLGAGYGQLMQPNGRDNANFFSAFGGVRLEPRLGSAGRIWVDGNAGYHGIGTADRFGLDAGLGLEFFVSRTIALGPFARLTHTFNGRDGELARNLATNPGGDTTFWVAGLSVAIYSAVPPPSAPPPPPPPDDTDHDGLPDPDDACPSQPSGAHPNPDRHGCPLEDTDGDGLFGADDLCPEQAMGEHPDPARAGCPLVDTDQDGVFGPEDLCPEQAAGDHPNPERRGCPDADGDSDGVFDHGDQCPTEPAGIHPDPARAGCPAPDRDHDNIPDAVDHCPDRPGAPSSNPNRNGCPGLLVMENGALHILRPVQFAPNSDRILPASTALMNSIADALRVTPEVRRVAIEGHTDDVGDDAANLELSRRRAASVVTWLTTTGRIEAARLSSEGFGETRPVEPGTTRSIRARNRRVEFRIVEVAH